MSVAFRPRRASIRRRLLAAFVFLALSMGAALGLAGRLSFDSLGAALLAWHTRPVMDALMEAERRAWEAEDRGGEKLYYGEDLAAVMHWRFLVGKEVPDPWRALPDGLHLTENSRDFVLVARRDNVIYALSGEVGVFAALNQKLTGALLLCALVTGAVTGLTVAGLAAMFVLGIGYKRDKLAYNPETDDTISVDTGEVVKHGDGQDEETVMEHITENLPGKKGGNR